jgi:penicillin G amidase
MRRLKIIVVWFLGMAAVLVAGGFIYMRSSLPDYHGSFTIAGLDGPVSIVRDERAVPHIEASSMHDINFAMGWVHAQDRLWQLDKNRHLARGSLSEVVGTGAVGTDRFLRTLGIHQAAQSAWDNLDSDTRALIEAYAAGVNAYIEMRQGALPAEFLILGHQMEPWSPVDTMGWMKMMALDLSGHWRREINRLALSSRLTPEQIADVYPPFRGDAPIATPDLDALYEGYLRLNERVALVDVDEESRGSNNWVVSGRRTITGKPLLANDPHLGFSTPSIWYLAHLSLNGKNVVGVSLPGNPFIVLGRNDTAAWGFTNTGPDVQDLYLERLTEDGAHYETPDGSNALTVREETLNVKDGDPVTFEVRQTRHGPVISDVLPRVQSQLGDGLVLALRWTALDASDSTILSSTEMFNIRSFSDFVATMQHFDVPEQNMVFANVDGEIGYYAPGNVPIRGAENISLGRVPAPGWRAEFDWQGYIPKDELPRIYNPESGYIATANAKIIDDDYPYYISDQWALPYRTNRIEALIEATALHDRDSFAAMQRDVYSPMAIDFLQFMLPAIAQSHPAEHDLMSRFDGNMERDQPGPLIYYAWHRALSLLLIQDEIGEEARRYWGLNAEFVLNILSNKDGQGRWCDDVTTTAAETCEAMIRQALDIAMDELKNVYGPDWKDWQWGDAHIARHEHVPFSFVPALRNFFENSISVPGGPYTINVTNIRTRAASPFNSNHGASYRAIYDLADLENSLYVIPNGQSGNVFSPYYDDLLEDWRDGRYFTISTDFEVIRSNSIGEMTLNPGESP